MSEFRNPYHFIPVKETGLDPEQQWRTDAREFRSHGPSEGDSHDRYASSVGTHARWSGRIICRLIAQTPIVVGAEQRRPKLSDRADDYAYVKPYRWNGRPAIPATSLKGMISSIAEAASGSALRVLHDRKPLSYRQPMNRALHALGMIVDGGEPGALAIQPLTLPLLQRGTSGKARFADWEKPWSQVFAQYANLKVYIGAYNDLVDEKVRQVARQFGRQEIKPTISDVSANEFAQSLPIMPSQSDPISTCDSFYYMRVSPGSDVSSFLANPPSARERPNRDRTLFTIYGQVGADGPNGKSGGILTEAEYKKLGRPADFVRGIIRILGAEGRKIPDNKKHELFIPYPVGIEQLARPLPIPEHVRDKFDELARQRAEDNDDNREQGQDDQTTPEPQAVRQRLPYLPFDSDENESASWDVQETGLVLPKLRKGQIVYFDIAKGLEPRVTAISFSAIWRDCATEGDEQRLLGVHDFFSDIDKELIPYHDGRDWLTPAERLFGFVSAARNPGTKKSAYAGRVHFSIATLEVDPGNDSIFLSTEAEGCDQADADGVPHVRLKVLASPKLPSPALYFTRDANRDRGKVPLQAGDHPQGRKAYLHHHTDGAPEPQPWRTKLPKDSEEERKQRKLKNAVRPIKKSTRFAFHIDFNNLTEREIDLLAFALRPTTAFRHKLGMGKSIGLGTVKIDPVALLLMDRTARYCTDDIFSPIRWHRKSALAGAIIPAEYEQDLSSAGNCATMGLETRATTYKAWASEPNRWPEAIHALILIGEGNHDENANNDGVPVHTPLTSEQSNDEVMREQDTFDWHSINAKIALEPRKYTETPQQLEPIGDKDEIPRLLKLARRQGRSGSGPAARPRKT
jgi:CRISPR-associated protein (TIGR03986 family)